MMVNESTTIKQFHMNLRCILVLEFTIGRRHSFYRHVTGQKTPINMTDIKRPEI